MLTKLNKALVLYVFEPEQASYQCKECAYFFDPESRCTQYKPGSDTVKAIGSCNLWDSNKHGYIRGTGNRSKDDTGYMENNAGFGCRRCEEFVADTKRCKKVDESGSPTRGIIHPLACCSRWEPDPTRANLSGKTLATMKNYH